MKSPSQPEVRKPGRSFDDPSKPMGEALLDRSGPSDTIPEDFRSRERQAAATSHGVAERAKAVAVLRKADELMAEANLPESDRSPHRALELAAGRVGLTYGEYRALVDGDPELEKLEAQVLAVYPKPKPKLA